MDPEKSFFWQSATACDCSAHPTQMLDYSAQTCYTEREWGGENISLFSIFCAHFQFPLGSASSAPFTLIFFCFLVFSPKPAEVVWGNLFALCPSSLVTASSASPA